MSPVSLPDHANVYRRIRRRELHSSRATLAVTIALVLIIVLVYFGAEIVLAFFAQPPLLIAMPALARTMVDLPAVSASVTVLIGIVAVLIGIVLMIAALSSARQARHLIDTDSTAAIVDNEVIASALARCAADASQLSPDNVRVSVSLRSAVVHLTPISGVPIDKDDVRTAVEEHLFSYHLTPSLSLTIIVSKAGKVGS